MSASPRPWSVKKFGYKVDLGDDNTVWEQAASILDAKGNHVIQGMKVENAEIIVAAVNQYQKEMSPW